jgi:hypothetical protein
MYCSYKTNRGVGCSRDMSSSTNYYVTFELQNGERKELEVRGRVRLD